MHILTCMGTRQSLYQGEMHMDLEKHEHDRPQDIDDLIFEQEAWFQVSDR